MKSTNTSSTQTQRRMERRQTIILLVLVLGVSLASFTLGVIVGRRGAERDLAYRMQQSERVLVAQAPAAPVTAVPPRVTVTERGAVADERQESAPVESKTELTFYGDLTKEPRQSKPLGTGINDAPPKAEEKAESVVDAPVVKPAANATEKPAEPASAGGTEEAAVTALDTELPQVTAGGSHAVQVGAFNVAGDAVALKQRLEKDGYPAFVVEADLAEKGIWYRVRIGPYADAATAKHAQEVLEIKEQIKGFVARQ
ncbi:MAG: hypothetical protein C0622_09950 [Desulfuromonas sp.]|nr:MAG: hypothetical protein C0622_09950 [Desulfuromonas sp.]